MLHVADADADGFSTCVAMRARECCKGKQVKAVSARRHGGHGDMQGHAELTTQRSISSELFSNHEARNQLVTPGIARRQDRLAGEVGKGIHARFILFMIDAISWILSRLNQKHERCFLLVSPHISPTSKPSYRRFLHIHGIGLATVRLATVGSISSHVSNMATCVYIPT
ncbi:hypothetical protein GGR52DRAFT_257655 [Hypoxylon sp. FL1284]|nr:hypothetical protein GGR52DRAFT_257655 [Hypoxylon sp. FL1284]